MHLIMISESLLYILLVVTGCGCTELQDKAFRSLVSLCPAQYIPSDNNTWSTLNLTSDYASCCTDNFTASPIGNIVTNRPDFSGSGQRCLFPSIETNPTNWPMKRSYYMIDRAPDGDCVVPDVDTQSTKNDDLILSKATCNDSEVIPSRRFLPSFSPSSGFIYKNPHCAYCHGRYDITIWKQRVQCSITMAFTDECNLYFSYIGDYSDIKHLQCFTDEFSSCPTKFSVENAGLPTDVDLSRKDISDACLMDRLPRFDFQYYSSKNVFCYICQNCLKRKNCLIGVCPEHLYEDSRGHSRRSFIRILDPNVPPSTSSQDLSWPDRDNALCQLDENGKVCYAVLCPIGQGSTYNGEKIVCKMDSIQWMTDNLAIMLSLKFDNRKSVRKSVLKTIFANDQIKSPWQRTWRLYSVYMPIYRSVNMTSLPDKYRVHNITTRRPINSITHLYVEMSYVHNVVKPEALLRDIRETLTKQWYLNTGLETITATQSISKFRFSYIKDSDSGEPFFVPRWQLTPDVSTHERFLYEPVVSHLEPNVFFITKLIICRQVEIPLIYFNEIITSRFGILALRYNITKSFLFDGELYLQRKNNGEDSVRICISDAGCKLIPSCYLNVSPNIYYIITLFLGCTWTAHQVI